MKEVEFRRLEDLFAKSLQATKQENSGLIMSFKADISNMKNDIQTLKESLETLKKTVTDYIAQDTKDKAEIKENQRLIFDWQKKANPYVEEAERIDGWQSVTGRMSKVVLGFVTFLTVVGGSIWAIIKYLKS